MRTITEIIVHCSDTREGKNFTISDIDRWHRQQGWKGCGYHYVILLDGTIQQGRPQEQIGAHCRNHNQHSIGICYIGGKDQKNQSADTRTEQQKAALLQLLKELKQQFPQATIHSHSDFAKKTCPSFDATEEYKTL